MDIRFHKSKLTSEEQAAVTAGFQQQSIELDAPQYRKERFKWLATDVQGTLRGALTADLLWDWVYIDELWVCQTLRGNGIGRQLMQQAEAFATNKKLSGLWLWTQSWQAESFYRKLGYEEFTRFDDFPASHARIGFRKHA